jgi:iron complex transport system substrate-binding protein
MKLCNKKSMTSMNIIFTLMMMLVLCAGCRAQNDSSGQEANPEAMKENPAEITLTDMTGRQVVLPQPAKRVVALQPSEVEILYAIEADEYLVGVGTYCNYPSQAQEKTVLPSGADTNIESILALDPDLVIMANMDQSAEQVAQLEKMNIKVLLTEAQDIAGTYEAIRIIAQAVGKTAEGEALVQSMQSSFARLKEEAAGKTGQKIYFEVSPLEYGLWTAGENTFMEEIAELLGFENIFDDVEGWAQVSEEQVLSRDPQLIVTVTMYFGEGPTPVEEILARSGWQNVSAIKNKAVYNGDTDMLTRPGPRLVSGAQDLLAFVEQLS